MRSFQQIAHFFNHEYTNKEQRKSHNSIINAICCNLIYRMFAVVKRDDPFVNLARCSLQMS